MLENQTELNALSSCTIFNFAELDIAAVAWCNRESFHFSTMIILHASFNGEKVDTFCWNNFL